MVSMPSARASIGVAKRCGFDSQKALRKSYLMLYAEHLVKHPDAPFDMLFPAGEKK